MRNTRKFAANRDWLPLRTKHGDHAPSTRGRGFPTLREGASYRLPTLEISRRAGVSRPAAWRWQRHYAEEGVARLLREGSRKSGKATVAVATVAKMLALTSADPPGETTHWTGRAMAKAVNLSLRTVQRILAHLGGPQVQPTAGAPCRSTRTGAVAYLSCWRFPRRKDACDGEGAG